MSDGESKSLSQQLIEARIDKGASLEDVHRATGISPSVLRGFEAEQYDVVEAVFTRLALGTYAVYLGLNEHAVLRAFDDEYGTTSDPIRPVSTGRIDEEKRLVGSHIDGGVLRVIGLVGGALAVLSLAISILGDREDAQGSPTAASVRENTTPIVSDPVSPKFMSIQQDVRETGLGRDGKEPAVVSVESDSTLGTGDVSVENARESSVAEVVNGVDVRVATVVDTSLRDIPVRDDWLVLQIEAVDSTWVQVRWDESGLFDAIVPPGRKYSWKARDSFTVHSGKAHGMRYTFQGEVLGNGSLGDPNRVLRFLANAEGVMLLGPDFEPLSSSLQP